MSSVSIALTTSANPVTEIFGRPFRLGHRPVLDGVRGLSIILVLLHHASFTVSALAIDFLPGGFLGVDIFFVLSGFLITSILVEEHNLAGTIDLKRFYIRRALRLFPAAAAVLLFSLAVGAVVGFDLLGLTPLRIASIVGYFTNWVRAFESNRLWFLTHFWSLAIEEQFYLIWPASLIAMLRFFQRRTILKIVGTLIVASTALMALLYLSGSSLLRVYTGSDTRAHSLLIGCLLSLALHWGYLSNISEKLLKTSALGGLSVLLLASAFFKPETPSLRTGGFALLAICAALLIWYLVVATSGLLHTVFSHPVLQWIGKRSYGLYVWHWPMYFLAGRAFRPALAIPFGIVAAFAVSTFSYAFIESPFLRLKDHFIVKQS